MTIRLLSIAIIWVSAVAGCSQEGEQAADQHAQDNTGNAPTNRIEIPATVRSNLGITFAPVERRRVNSTIRVPGAFELEPLARHEYRMTLPGRVELMVDQYQPVESGDVLYRFRSPEWPELQHEIIVGEQGIDSARAEIKVVRARIVETRQRLSILRERLTTLAQAEFKQAALETEAAELEAAIPRLSAELELVETKLANAQRTREHALHRASAATGIQEHELSAQIKRDGSVQPAYRSIDWIEVRASEPGVVESLSATNGAFVEAPSLVLSVIDPRRVRFRGIALQADLARLSANGGARIVPPSSAGIPVVDTVRASVVIGLEANPEQRTVALLATPEDSRAWFRPGVSAFLEVEVASSEGLALTIPRAAIVQDGIVHVFFRRDPKDPNKAIRVEADMGVSDGRWVAINSGIALTDEVVLSGAYELKLATQQDGSAQKGGHFHADGTFHEEAH